MFYLEGVTQTTTCHPTTIIRTLEIKYQNPNQEKETDMNLSPQIQIIT